MATTATLIAATSLAVGLAGTATQIKGQKKAAKASRQAEKQRQLQSRLESQRARRQAVRDVQLKQAEITSNAVSQGVDLGSSSVQGGIQSAQSSGNRQIQGINQSREISDNIFSANQQISRGRSLSAIGSGVSNFANSIFNNSEKIGQISKSFGFN